MKFKKLATRIIIIFMMLSTVSAVKKYAKVAFVGNLKSGKTAIFKRLFDLGYNPMEERFHSLDCGRKELLDYNGDVLNLEIWDTAGLKDYYREVIEHTRHMNFVFIVHDLSQKYDKKVEDYLIKIYKDVHEKIAADGKIVLIGSKYDLRHDNILTASANAKLIKEVAEIIPTAYMLTSAKDNVEISEILDFIKWESQRMDLPCQGLDLGDSIRLGTAQKANCCG